MYSRCADLDNLVEISDNALSGLGGLNHILLLKDMNLAHLDFSFFSSFSCSKLVLAIRDTPPISTTKF